MSDYAGNITNRLLEGLQGLRDLKAAGAPLEICFGHREQKTRAVFNERKDVVTLFLNEPKSPEDFNDWAEALGRVPEMLDHAEYVRIHNLQHPDFWERIVAAFDYDQAIVLRKEVPDAQD